MKFRLVLLVLGCLFVFAQYISFEQVTSIGADISAADDIEDYEDVIPVDPFLAPIASKPQQQQAVFGAIAASAASAAPPKDSDDNSSSKRSQKQNNAPWPVRLWLINRTLLI